MIQNNAFRFGGYREEPPGEIKRTKHNIAFMKEREGDMASPWAYYDSPLCEGPDSYQATFRNLIPSNYATLKEYVEDVLSGKKGRAIGADLGGPGSRIFSDFSSGFFQDTYGITLRDIRKEPIAKEDATRNHHIIAGDMRGTAMKQMIREKLDKKADVIFERMEGGLMLFPRDARWATEALNQIYGLLSDEGVIFLQSTYDKIPSESYEVVPSSTLESYARILKTSFPGLLEVSSDGKSLKIRKVSGDAPKRLPDILF